MEVLERSAVLMAEARRLANDARGLMDEVVFAREGIAQLIRWAEKQDVIAGSEVAARLELLQRAMRGAK